MENKKKVTILVTIALILAITAITLNATDSKVPTTIQQVQDIPTGAVIGIEIQPSPVEDKLAEQTLQQ